MKESDVAGGFPDLPVPDWHLEVLEKRSEELDRLPEEERARPWEAIKREIWSEEGPGNAKPSRHGMK